MTGPSDYDDAQTRKIMALVALAFIAAGALGYLLYARLVILWIVLGAFGIAALGRVGVAKARETRAEHSPRRR